MLYTFIRLSDKLTELGYPPATESGFRVIKRDLTEEEQAGRIEFKEEGIYLAVDGEEYRGYMYLKFPDVARFGLPKFHITNCQTVVTQRQSGTFDGRYFWHNSDTVTIEDRRTGITHNDIPLDLCGNCRRQLLITQYSDTEGFYNLLDAQESSEFRQEVAVDIFGYTLDWQQISRQFRRENDYKCECCQFQVEAVADRRFIHVHHRNGDKLNNRRSNLESICVLCHSYKDATHEQNFERRRMQAEVKLFVNKHRSELQRLGNPFLHRVL